MGNQFFGGWALWEKLCFVLGLAIAVTICLGGVKLAYTHYRLRKYSKVAERERGEQARRRETAQRQHGSGQQRNEEVPFGVRAIERGVEVDGVWISRPTTPDATPRDRSASSSIWTDTSQKRIEPDLEAQLPAARPSSDRPHPNRKAPSPNRVSFAPSARTASTERPPTGRDVRDSSLKIAPVMLEKPPRSRHPPLSLHKYAGNPSLHRNSATVNALEGIEAIYRASTEFRHDTSLESGSRESYSLSSSGSSDGGPISAAAPKLFGKSKPASATRKRDHSADFELLDTRRTSQAAETGQLTPSSKKPVSSRGWQAFPPEGTASAILTNGHHSTTDASNGQSPTVPPSPRGDAPRSPSIEALPAALRRSSMPDGVQPFAQFVQIAPALPRPTASTPSESPNRQRQTSKGRSVSHERPASRERPISRERPTAETLRAYASMMSSDPSTASVEQGVNGEPTRSVRQFFEKEGRAEVVRGAGSGFEILKPGSLKPTMPDDEVEEKQRGRAPPISLQTFRQLRQRSRSSSTGTGRKLQKKRRPSDSSQTSSKNGHGDVAAY